jgi:hypothetical protein
MSVGRIYFHKGENGSEFGVHATDAHGYIVHLRPTPSNPVYHRIGDDDLVALRDAINVELNKREATS